jgi:WD40 repeat protein/DNA-binding winged helix-turn-helix (wHTH) protein
MHNPERVRNGFRFGPFLLDEETGELYRNGNVFKRLRPQEHKVLVALLEHTPSAIKWPELVELLWGKGGKQPEGGLKKVIRWLRKDLEDSARSPQFIQVLPRVGPRFIFAVEKLRTRTANPTEVLEPDQKTVSDELSYGRFARTTTRGVINSVSSEDSKQLQIRSAEYSESIGDVWRAAEIYEVLASEMQHSGNANLAGEMDRRAQKCRSAAAQMMRDGVENPKPESSSVFTASFDKLGTSVGQTLPANQKPQLQVPIEVMERGNFVWGWFFSNDSRRLCICGPEKKIKVYAMPTCELVATLNHRGPVQHLVCHPKRDLLVSLAFDHSRPKASDRPDSIHVWDLRTQRQLNVRVHQKGAEGLVISPEGSWLISIGHLLRNRSILWKFASRKGTLELTSRFDYNGVIDAAFSPVRELVALACADGTVRVLNLTTMVEHARLEHYDEVTKVAFSHDGQRIATASKDCSACLWDTASGHKLARFGHKEMLCDVAFSPDDQWVATAADDFACIWNVSTGKEVCRLLHEGRGALKLSFSRTGGYIATGGFDSTARVWKVPSGQEIAGLHHDVYAGELSNVAFSSDSQLIATGGGHDGVAVWAVPE